MKIGDIAKDLITGFEGLVQATSESIVNCPQVLIKPMALDNGKPIDGVWFDAPQCEVIGVSTVPVIQAGKAGFKLGDMVKDKYTSFTGTVVSVTIWINGCYRYGVQGTSTRKEDGLSSDPDWFADNRLELVKQAEEKAPIVRTGGPMKAPRMPATQR